MPTETSKKECKCICHKGINPFQKQENWSRAGHSPQLCFCHHKQRLEKIVDKVNEDQKKFMETPEPQNESWEERFDELFFPLGKDMEKYASGEIKVLTTENKIKSFIHKELSRAEQAGRDKLLKELDITKDFKGAEIKRIKEQAKQERTKEIIEWVNNNTEMFAMIPKPDILSHLQSYLESNTKE